MEERMTIRLPARFLSVGQCVAHEGWLHPARTLDSAVLIVVEQGRFGMTVGQRQFALEAKQAVLLPAGIAHAGVRVEGEEAPRYYWTHFREGADAGGNRIELGLMPICLSEMTYNRLASGFHQLISESSVAGENAVICDYMLSLLLLEAQRGDREAPRTAVANRMFEYIRLHCFDRLTLSDLSRELGYSEDYLSRLFHEYADCSYRQYIHRLRMSRAKKELLSGTKSIQQIAVECGYSNAKFFSTVFMKHEGVTPSDYRNMYGGIHQNNA